MPRICKTCGLEKDDDSFYPSITTYCRACWRQRVRENRAANPEQYRAYDRLRANRPDRVAARAAYQASEHGRETGNAAKRRYAARPDRRTAHIALGNAIRDGHVIRQPCLVCGEPKSDGHHFDYGRPLDVIWLCRHHHSAFHKVEREINRKKESAA